MKKMVFLFRYPLDAIASNFNHIYWRKHGIFSQPSQPPVNEWEKWRDENIEIELDAWVNLLKY
jgi:hypothetical protein